MIGLLLSGLASLGAAWYLWKTGLWRTHNALLVLLAFDALAILSLYQMPSIWSYQGAVVVNTLKCMLAAAVAVEAGMRARMEPDVVLQALLALGVAWGTFSIIAMIPGDGPARPLIAPYLAAAFVIGAVAQRAPVLDRLDRGALVALGTTRYLQALRLASTELHPHWKPLVDGLGDLGPAGQAIASINWPVVFDGWSKVAWIVWCGAVFFHCFIHHRRPPRGWPPPRP